MMTHGSVACGCRDARAWNRPELRQPLSYNGWWAIWAKRTSHHARRVSLPLRRQRLAQNLRRRDGDKVLPVIPRPAGNAGKQDTDAPPAAGVVEFRRVNRRTRSRPTRRRLNHQTSLAAGSNCDCHDSTPTSSLLRAIPCGGHSCHPWSGRRGRCTCYASTDRRLHSGRQTAGHRMFWSGVIGEFRQGRPSIPATAFSTRHCHSDRARQQARLREPR
jgi:hypothetical protein